jgi:hypothetical protein
MEFYKIQGEVTLQKQAVSNCHIFLGSPTNQLAESVPFASLHISLYSKDYKQAPGLLALFVNSVEMRMLAFHVLRIYSLSDNLLESLVQYKVI